MVSKVTVDQMVAFSKLFSGRHDAYGLDRGGVVKDTLTTRMYGDHLKGLPTAGIGVFPLRDDNTVRFAAIDLDEPNFELALDIATLLPARCYIERSRSGNAHIWVFFDAACPAWVARGQLRKALEAVGRKDVEIFPKQAELREGMVGNYINLPYYGDERKIIYASGDEWLGDEGGYTLDGFLFDVEDDGRASVEHWTNLCRVDGIEPPPKRDTNDEWGERSVPHGCALYMLEHKEDNPLTQGHRHVVLFNLAKMLLNCKDWSIDDVLVAVEGYNDAGESPVSRGEIKSMVQNAARGRWTSTGCDDPVMAPYVSPDCGIANG